MRKALLKLFAALNLNAPVLAVMERDPYHPWTLKEVAGQLGVGVRPSMVYEAIKRLEAEARVYTLRVSGVLYCRTIPFSG